MNQLLGEQPRNAYLTGVEVVNRLEKLAANCPVRDGVRVRRLAPADDAYILRTDHGDVQTRTVVIASGDENVPRIPALAAALPDRVEQLHAADYRAPGQLPGGVVLVVGSGQSGCQITEDLIAAGRSVVLATSPVGRVPTPYRGRDSIEWLVEAGFYEQRPRDLPDPAMVHAPNPQLAPGRAISLQALARSGVTLVGRPTAAHGEQVTFDDSAHANVAAGDAFAARARTMMDDIIRRLGPQAPPAEPDDTGPVDMDPPTAIDLRAHEVDSVVWCTGFSGDFSWLDPGLVNADGRPRHAEAAAPVPGVWYLGLRWLTRRASGILLGMPGDATTVADAVKAHLADQPVRHPTTKDLQR
jgi:putative flavoprotein involved in K+ transport